MRDLQADLLFLGVDSLDPEIGLMTPHVLEAQLNAQMIRIARTVVAVTDSSKLLRRNLSVIAPVEAVDILITDRSADAELHRRRDRGVEVRLVALRGNIPEIPAGGRDEPGGIFKRGRYGQSHRREGAWLTAGLSSGQWGPAASLPASRVGGRRPSFRPTTGTVTTGEPHRRSAIGSTRIHFRNTPRRGAAGIEVVMATTPSDQIVPNFGMGLVTYVTGDFGGNTFRGQDMEKAIEAFAQVPMGQKLYLRPTWQELQKRPGRLDPDAYWTTVFAVTKQYGKRVGFRVMMSAPDIAEPALPDFVLAKVPMVRLRAGSGSAGRACSRRCTRSRATTPVLPGRVPRAERAPGRGVRRQRARRVRGHLHVRLLG